MRDRIELYFGRWGHFAYHRAWWVIAAVLAVTGGLATQMQHFYVDTTSEGFFHEDDPIRVSYDRYREQFGRDTQILVLLRPTADVFSIGFLEKLREIHDQIEEEVPLLVDVTSLINARETRGEADELIVGDFLEILPDTEAGVLEARDRAVANPLYVDFLISEDARITTIVIDTEVYTQLGDDEEALAGFEDDGFADAAAEPPPFLSGEENDHIIEVLHEVLDRHRSDELEIYVVGTPVLMERLQRMMMSDMTRFTGLAILAISLFLAMLFRRAAGVILPLITVALAVITTMSIMAATGTPLTSPTQIIPSFLLAVGVGASVHILAIFYQARRQGQDKENAIAHALGHSGLAVAMTALTTAGGLLSFGAAALLPIAHFGLFAPVGVMVSFLYAVIMLPALIAITPMRSKVGSSGNETFASQRLLVRIGSISTHRPPLVVGAWAILIALSLWGATKVPLAHDPIKWFPAGDELRVAMEVVNDEIGGATSLEVLIRTDRENALHEPDLLERIDSLSRSVEGIEADGVYIGKTLSLVDIVKETHRALNENRPEAYRIPTERALISQELLLFENAGSDDLEDFVDPQFSIGRLSMRMPFAEATRYTGLFESVQRAAKETFGDQYPVEMTGMMVLIESTIGAVLDTMVRSYIIALMIIAPLMILLIGNLRIGVVAMIPNLAPIVVTLGLMGWVQIPLDVFTLLIGSIAIGLAVDDTIHFMHNFRRYYEQSGDVHDAVRRTLETTGQALLFTSLVLASGFYLYTFAYMDHLWNFGILTSLTIVTAFLADVTLAPALLVWVARRSPASEATLAGRDEEAPARAH